MKRLKSCALRDLFFQLSSGTSCAIVYTIENLSIMISNDGESSPKLVPSARKEQCKPFGTIWVKFAPELFR